MHEQDFGVAETASSMGVLAQDAKIGSQAVVAAEQAARRAAIIATQIDGMANVLTHSTDNIKHNVSDFLATVRAA